MNRLLEMIPFINGRKNRQTVNRIVQSLQGKRNNRNGLWLSVAALALGGAIYGMQRRQINRGIMRAGQSLLNR